MSNQSQKGIAFKTTVVAAALAVVASGAFVATPAMASPTTDSSPSVEASQDSTPTQTPSEPAKVQPEKVQTAKPQTSKPTSPTKAATPAKPVKPKKRATVKAKPNPTLKQVLAGKAILRPNSKGQAVRVLQQRLNLAGYPRVKTTGTYNKPTGQAVRGIREKFMFSDANAVSSGVMKRLMRITTKSKRVPSVCRKQKKALCISKSQMVVRYYKRGKLIRVMDARFGSGKTPTRVGNFRVHTKIANGTSDLSGTWMPWALYFSRSQAVHYSPGFNASGYYGASLGCVNLRSLKQSKWLYRQIPRGTFVKVYR